MKKKFLERLAVVVFCVATAGVGANASTITPETSTVSVVNSSTTQSNTATGPNSVSLSGGTGTVVVSPNLSVTSSIDDSMTVFPAGAQGVISTLDYYFEVVGGSAGDLVPVLIQTGLSTSQTGVDSYAFSEINIGNGALIEDVSNCLTCTGPSTFNGTLEDSFASGAVIDVHFYTEASVNIAFPGGTASASGDPHIYVDPTFANAANYCIAVSAGVGNDGSCGASTTPLPAALPLFATGLGAVGLLGWRRKRKNTAAVATV